jgi:hypothetical protein
MFLSFQQPWPNPPAPRGPGRSSSSFFFLLQPMPSSTPVLVQDKDRGDQHGYLLGHSYWIHVGKDVVTSRTEEDWNASFLAIRMFYTIFDTSSCPDVVKRMQKWILFRRQNQKMTFVNGC